MLKHFLHPQRSNNHRPKLLHPEAFFLLSLVIGSLIILLNALSSVSILSHILGFASSIAPSGVLSQTNIERKKLELKPLMINHELNAAALAKGQDMFNDQYWSHVAHDGKQPWDFMQENNYIYVVAGENLARDFSDTNGMVKAWMESPTHRANIINGKYTETGIAVIDGVLEGTETTLVVQMFGNRGNAAQISKKAESTTEQVMAKENTAQEIERKQELQRFALDNSKEDSSVLAGALIPVGNLKNSPLLSPLQLSKALILFVVIIVLLTLFYDLTVIGHVKTMRIVGKNLAHIMLFILISFLIIFFRAGVVG
ncbi:MAG: CAP domain-containing protein [Patescibacteria group bacterium]